MSVYQKRIEDNKNKKQEKIIKISICKINTIKCRKLSDNKDIRTKT